MVPPSASIRIGILGTPVTSGNRGVLALGASLARLCLEASPAAKVVLFGSHPDAGPVTLRPHGKPVSLLIVHWRMSPRGGLRHQLFVIFAFSFLYRFLPVPALRRRIAAAIPWIGALEATAQVGDVRGGDSFSDIYGLKRFLLATLPVVSVIWVKGGIVQFPQTYGPYRSRLARVVARWILRRSSVIIARDRDSQKVAQALAGPARTVQLSPDVAFALHADTMASALFDDRTEPEPVPADAIGLNVNGLMYNGGYTGRNMFGLQLDYPRFVHELAVRLLAIQPGPLLLIPHTYAPAGDVESDNDACRHLKAGLPAALQARVRIVTGDYDAHQLKGLIGRCGFFVGSRMHSCIAALSQGVPCAGVAYSMKFRGVFESVGLADWVVDGRATDTTAAVCAVAGFYEHRGDRQAALQEQAEAGRRRLRHVFALLLQPGAANRHRADG